MEAVHFAVALAYYGLLKAPEEPLKTSFDLRKSIARLQEKQKNANTLHYRSDLPT